MAPFFWPTLYMKSLANHQHQQQLQGKALAATVAVYWRGRGHVACTSFYSNDSDGSHRCSAATVDPTHPPGGANVRPVAKIIGKNKNLLCTVGKWSFNSWFLGHIASLSPPNGAPISPDAFARLWTNPNGSFTPFDATRQLQCRAALGGVNWSLETVADDGGNLRSGHAQSNCTVYIGDATKQWWTRWHSPPRDLWNSGSMRAKGLWPATDCISLVLIGYCGSSPDRRHVDCSEFSTILN